MSTLSVRLPRYAGTDPHIKGYLDQLAVKLEQALSNIGPSLITPGAAATIGGAGGLTVPGSLDVAGTVTFTTLENAPFVRVSSTGVLASGALGASGNLTLSGGTLDLSPSVNLTGTISATGLVDSGVASAPFVFTNAGGTLASGTLAGTLSFSAGTLSVAGLPTLASIAALRANTAALPPQYVLGWRAIRDGGQGVFAINSADTSSSDNGGTIIVDAGGHRWYRELDNAGIVTSKQFGCYADGAHDDTAALQAMLTWLNAAGGKGYVLPGGYVTSAALALTIAFGTPVDVEGFGAGSVQILCGGTGDGIDVTLLTGTATTLSPTFGFALSGVTVERTNASAGGKGISIAVSSTGTGTLPPAVNMFNVRVTNSGTANAWTNELSIDASIPLVTVLCVPH